MSKEAEEILYKVLSEDFAGRSLLPHEWDEMPLKKHIFRAMEAYKNLSSPQEVTDNEIYRQILIHLDSLPYAGGFPGNYKETLAKHLGDYLRSKLNK